MLNRLPLRYFRSWWGLLAAVFLIAILVVTFSEIDRPTYSPPSGGEQWSYTAFSDFATLLAGKRFHKDGLAESYFLSNSTVGFSEFARSWYSYQTPLTHIPQAHIYTLHTGSYDAMTVALWFQVGVTRLSDFYKIAAVFSVIALGLWYGAATFLFGRAIALVSLFFMGTSLLFLQFIYTVAGYTYDILFAFGAVFLFLLAERKGGTLGLGKIMAYGGAWVLAFLLAGNSLEFVPWLIIFLIGYLWAKLGRQAWRRWKAAALLAAASVLAQLLRVLQVSVALGGLEYTITDFAAYRTFPLERVIPKYEGDLWVGLRLELIGMVALLALAWWLTHRLGKSSPVEARQQLWYRWKLLLVLLVAGISFWVLMIQATVTSTGSVYRTIVPFVGLTIGYCLVQSTHYLRLSQERWQFKAATLLVLVALSAPLAQHRFSGEVFNSRAYFQSIGGYFGMYPEEIKMLGIFLKEKTAYGDVVVTDLRVAETGHPRYPFPAYEYVSDRRVEVARDVGQAMMALGEFEQVRVSLPLGNPASGVQFYLLTDEGSIEEDFGQFARRVGGLQDTLYETDYWTGLYGAVPFPTGSSMSFPPRIFYLFKVDAAKFSAYQLATGSVDGRSPQP